MPTTMMQGVKGRRNQRYPEWVPEMVLRYLCSDGSLSVPILGGLLWPISMQNDGWS